MTIQEAKEYLSTPMGELFKSIVVDSYMNSQDMDKAVLDATNRVNDFLCEMREGKTDNARMFSQLVFEKAKQILNG